MEWPAGTRFDRLGNPDGGREGRAILPDGKVCAWQVKYLFRFNGSAAHQVEKSFKRILETEPDLCRYFVVLPTDRTGGDSDVSTSELTRWTTKVKEWMSLAEQFGRSVDFEFVGRHELVKALLDPAQLGRVRYWFDQAVMDGVWFRNRLDETIEKAGSRYSPEVHIGVEAVRVLEGLSRTEQFKTEWVRALAKLRENRRWTPAAPEDDTGEVVAGLARCEAKLAEVDGRIVSVIASLGGFGDLPAADEQIQAAKEELWKLRRLLHTNHPPKDGYYTGDAGAVSSYVQGALGALRALSEIAGSAGTRAARMRDVLITGKAGTGKTHLLCDIAKKRVDAGLPTVLVMGQDFDSRVPRVQIPELTGFVGSFEEELAVLAAAAEASETVGLLMVDALNESETPERWKDELRVLQTMAARHDQIALAVSCRSDFVPYVVGETSMPTMVHEGFGEATETAVMRYAREYGLDAVSFPVLNPEFSNPLFLRLTCEALKTLGHDRFLLGSAGLTIVCDAFLEAVNKRLSSPGRCDFDEEDNLVRKAARALAAATSDGLFLDRETTKSILYDLLPRQEWSKSLMKGLLDEGVLIATPTQIRFGYQRLGDVVQASWLCEKTGEEIKEWAAGLGHNRWTYRGVLGALAVMLPERKGVELVADEDKTVDWDDIQLFAESLVLRSAESVTDKTVRMVRQLLDNDDHRETMCYQLVRLSCVPGHPLNAEWSHAWLMEQGLAERDSRWSLFLIEKTEDTTPVRRLISWARDNSRDAESSVRRLAGLTLGWMLTTPDNRVRDQATKALVALFEPQPITAQEVLLSFRGVNDPYVVERLAGVACGVALRSSDPSTRQKLATGTAALLSGSWPAHLLTRDYAHRVFKLALGTGWAPPDGADPNGYPYAGPPYGAELPSPLRTIDEIKAMSGPPDYRYSSIVSSLHEQGDFGEYILSPTLLSFVNQDENELFDLAQRAIFERVLDLGWTPEVFRAIDRRLHSGSRTDHAVERVGKKYQRIAFNELLGRLADHFPVGERWFDGAPGPYSHAEQLIWRDIDPTVIARRPETDEIECPRVWFSTAQTEFDPSETGHQPSGISGIPDPLDLIAVQDDNGRPWLVLETFLSQREPLPPEQTALQHPELLVRMRISSYLIRRTNLPAIRDWGDDKGWYIPWIPKRAEAYNVLLASHPNDPQWKPASGEIDWHRYKEDQPPCDLLATAAQYTGTGTNRDQSAPEEIRCFVPSKRLYELLNLTRAGDFAWANQQSATVVKDPSAAEGGPYSLLASREETVSRLKAKGLTILWTVQAEKDLIMPRYSRNENKQWVFASAAYKLDGSNVDRLGAAARLWERGPTEKAKLSWDPLLKQSG